MQTARNIARLLGIGKDVTVTSNLTMDAYRYDGKKLHLSAAAGLTVTLPTSTGSGKSYGFYVDTTITSNNYIIKVANSTDIMGGVATMGSAGGTSASLGTTTTSDTITMNGTTTAGIRGTYIRITDSVSGLYTVELHGVASGIAATPFSATV